MFEMMIYSTSTTAIKFNLPCVFNTNVLNPKHKSDLTCVLNCKIIIEELYLIKLDIEEFKSYYFL